MNYSIKNILPHPLEEQNSFEKSEIWNTTYEIVQGKNYLVKAPSGKGKSTFLHILYGLRKDYKGEVSFSNKRLETYTREEWSDLRKDNLSIVFQDLRLFPELNGLENIQINTALTGHKNQIEIESMAEKLGVQHLLHHPCQNLSYGQKQRIAIIRALCQPFDFLFLDEPFSHLDSENIERAMELIKSCCREQQAGFVLVSLGEDFDYDYDERLIL